MGDSERKFFVSGGTLPPDSASYLERSADENLLEALLDGRFCYVLNSRQFGKSSLSVHAIGRLEAQGVRTVFLDLTRIGGQNVTPEQWYSGIALAIGRGLGCRREVNAYWNEHSMVSPAQRLFDMLLDVALPKIGDATPLVVFIDEIDTTRSLAFNPDEFFAAIRECFNRRVSEPMFRRLTFCLLGVAVPSDLVRDRAITPFNIGERILLEDFTLEELSAYAPHLGPNGQEIVARVHHWTGGHPYLSQSICRSISVLEEPASSKTVDAIVQRELFDFKARESNINLADVANIALHHGDGASHGEELRADVLSVYKRVLTGRPVVDDESNRTVVLLKLSGIVRSNGRRLSVRNRIYRHVFDREWIEEHMPEQEIRRERQSFRRGVLRTGLVTGSMLLAVALVAGVTWYSRLQALKAEEKLDYELYVSDINSMRQFFETGETRRIEAVLNRHQNSRYRGFEWGYWLGRYHDAQEEYTLDYNAPGKRVEGHVSTDGKQVCIVDKLSLTATIVDRATKKVVRTTSIEAPQAVFASQTSWIEMRRLGPARFRALDLLTGWHFDLGKEDKDTWWAMPVEHSDYVVTGEGPLRSNKNLVLNFWNIRTGQRIFTMPNPWSESEQSPWKSSDLLNFSRDGRYFVYSRGPLKWRPGDPVPDTYPAPARGEAFVLDLRTKQIIDRFPVDSWTEASAKGFLGDHLLFLSRSRGFVRDFKSHKTTVLAPDIPGDFRIVGGVITGTNLITQLDGGRALIRDLTGSRPDNLRGNVFYIVAGATPRQYLASASSVRIYDAESPAGAKTIATGRQVTRYGPGVLNLFSANGRGIRRIEEASLRTVGTVPTMGDGGAYTYSGRWFLVREGNPTAAYLKSADGKTPPIRLPFFPALWSSGLSEDSIAVWGGGILSAYSGREKRVRWTRKDITGMNSLWVNPDGTRLFYGGSDRTITVLDMQNGRTLGILNSHNLGSIFVTFSSDNRRIFTCGGDGRAVMWDMKTLRKLAEFRGNDQEGLTSADISPDGRRLVTTSRSGSWQLWDTSNGVQLMDVRASAGSLSSAIFCADGKRIVTAGDDNQVRIWQTIDADPTTYIPLDPNYLKELHL